VRTWTDLETAFRDLARPGFEPRLDYQSGVAGENWRIVAILPGDAARFEALARISGTKLLSAPAVADWPDILAESDSVHRWYTALRQLSPAYRVDGYAVQEDRGQDGPVIWIGRIDNACEASAILCLRLESLAATPRMRAEALCSVPRYAGPCQHWRAAQGCLAAAEPDLSAAVHEAVSAVEGLCRIIVGDPNVTLGDALKRLAQRDLLHTALSKAIERVWGYSNTEPGVRHGASVLKVLKASEAEFAIDTCEAAVILLMAIDGGTGYEGHSQTSR
jgi:hypothetical protein